MERNAEYFKARAEEERQIARQASQPCARDRHLELAGEYDDLVDALSRNMIAGAA